jgi:hypothetical protein
MDQGPGDGGLPPAPPLLPKGVGDILNAAFTLYKENWQRFLTIVAVVAVPLSIIQYFLRDQFFTANIVRRVNPITGQPELTTSGGSFGRVVGGALLLGLINVIIYFVITAAITRAAASSVVGLPIDVSESYGYGIARLGSIALISILTGLAVGVGLIFLIIPGLIFAVKFAVSVPALVVEDRRGTAAMSRSWQLTGGHFWHVTGAVVVALLITSVASSILTIPFVNSGWFLQSIGAAIAQIVTAPFTALVTVLVYLDLRARKESLTSDGLRAELARSA